MILHRPICELVKTIPISEIRLWKAYIETEGQRHEKIEWYLAQIVQAVYETATKQHRPLNEYLIKFERPKHVVTKQDNDAARRWAMSWIRNMSAVSKKTPSQPKPSRKGKK